MADILAFKAQGDRALARHSLSADGDIDANELATQLGTPDEWAEAAIVYLKGQSVSAAGETDGMASVSRASLHVVLAYVERLETCLGIIQPPGAA